MDSHCGGLCNWKQFTLGSIIKECKGLSADAVQLYIDANYGKDLKEIVQHQNEISDFDRNMEIYNDPIHGSIQLNPLEHAIVNTPEFYRLKEIKQLGGKSHVFPGAVHTRFEHSIGVCHLAGTLINHLRRRSQPTQLLKRIPDGAEGEVKKHFEDLSDEDLGKQENLCVQLAGLCHDLGHGPFSHVFEGVTKKILGKKLSHEQISAMMLKRILLKHQRILAMFVGLGLTGEHVKMIINMIDCSKEIMKKLDPKEKYLYEVVANKESGMDVDKWDYFARDCRYLGLKNEFEFDRCIALSSIVDDHGEYHVGFREKEKRNIYGMFRTRCMLFQKAYYHSTAVGIEMMIKDALVAAQDIPLQTGSNRITLKIILDRAEKNDLDGYVHLTDSILTTLMLCQANENNKDKLDEVQKLITRISKRDIYKSVTSESFYSDEYKRSERKDTESSFELIDGDRDLEIEVIEIKYASESGHEDPVSKKVCFFKKEDVQHKIPARIKGTMIPESKVNVPKAFVEFQIRLYSKHTKSVRESKEEEIKKIVKLFPLYAELTRLVRKNATTRDF